MRVRPLAVAPVLAALALAGCSGAGSGSAAAPAAATTAAPTSSAATSTAPTPTAPTPSSAPAASVPSGSAPAGTGAPGSTSPAPAAPADASWRQVRAARLETQRLADFDHPTALAELNGDLYVTERSGRVRVLRDGRGRPRTLLDLRGKVGTEGERGLLGVAVAPDGAHLYLSYIDRGGDNRLDEYAVRDGELDEASRRGVLRVDQPGMTHVGGHVAFGPDGMLWMGIGEGGATHTASGGHAARTPPRGLDNLLGKIVRIDPRPSGRRGYTVPADNPYADREGARGEIWAYGMRNPWRWSIDRARQELWIGDVGHYEVEEITRLRLDDDGGANLGWPYFEGERRWQPGTPREPYVRPLLDYGHDDGRCAVIGGYVYRGTEIPDLAGAYLYSDFCNGSVRAVVVDGDRVRERDLDVGVKRAVSFGEDSRGELYLLSSKGAVFRLRAA